MRFYIVDNLGNIWGDFENRSKAEACLQNYSLKQIQEYELEIIEGN